MNKIIRNTALAALFVVPLWIGGCNKDNDFYEVGRQPVTLTRPAIDTGPSSSTTNIPIRSTPSRGVRAVISSTTSCASGWTSSSRPPANRTPA